MRASSSRFLNKARLELHLRRLYPPAALELARDRRALRDQPERFVVFVGYPRSSHSLLGAFLDAHPEMVVSHELDALAYIRRGAHRSLLFGLILARQRWFARRGYRWEGYGYEVPGQWQGQTTRLRVIGDKKGGGTARHLTDDPNLLETLEDRIGIPVHVIHVVRNPYDNVARIALRANAPDLTRAMASALRRYTLLVETVRDVRAAWPSDRWLDVGLEELCSAPHLHVAAMSTFLGVAAPTDWVDACATLVFESPRNARDEVSWEPAQLAALDELCSSTPWLQRYSGSDVQP